MREIKKISNMYVDKPFQMTDDSLERFKSATSHSEMKNTVKSGQAGDQSPKFGRRQSVEEEHVEK